jgi:class 3 adenylate cyclase
MAQEIQYCTSADGTRIAYSIVGGGPGVPLMFYAAPPFFNLTEPWRMFIRKEDQPSLSVLWQRRPVCLLNPRGCGLSDRNAADYDIDRLTEDLEAVAERTGWARFSLYGMGMSGPCTVLYTSRHPDTVSRLVLRDTYLRAADMGKIGPMRALGAVLRADYGTYLNLMAFVVRGWGEPDAMKDLVEYMSGVTSHESVMALASATASYNVTGLTDQIRVPTLVQNPNFMPVPSEDMARAMVAQIPDARLMLFALDEQALAMQRVEEFLAEGDEPATEVDLPSGTSIILFADIANSTTLTEQLGDEAFRAKARELDSALRDAIKANSGTPIEGKLLGDGVLATFGAARDAIACGRSCHEAADNVGLQLHVGIHAGDVIRENGDVFGGAVNVAARISDQSAAGETLVSGTVRDLARTSAGVEFEDKGERDLKGVAEPVRVWAVKSSGTAD